MEKKMNIDVYKCIVIMRKGFVVDYIYNILWVCLFGLVD